MNGIVVRFVVAWGLFALASLAPKALHGIVTPGLFEAHPTLPHFIVKSLLVIVAFAGIRLSGLTLAEAGFRRAQTPVHRVRVAATGGGIGALATLAILLSPAEGMREIASFGFVGIVLSVWIYSSLTEEIFVRGWFQSSIDLSGERRRARIVASGLLFGSLHLSLIWKGVDWPTIVIIVAATTALGLYCASLRERHESLLPPIGAHIAFNVGGFAAVIVLNILSVSIYKRPLTH
jgi:membrane protease YdiL (CAAX protease family)